MSGGFALVAWPAQYDATGIMTFIVNGEGIVFEKDLGQEHAGERQSRHALRPRRHLAQSAGGCRRQAVTPDQASRSRAAIALAICSP